MKILVLNQFRGNEADVFRDYLFSFNAHSRHEYHYVHAPRIVDRGFSFAGYDAIVLFWAYDWLRPGLSPETVQRIADAPAKKLLFLQDEYRSVELARTAIRRFGVNHMFTIVSAADHDLFYPRSQLPSLEGVHSVLTGYVPDALRSVVAPPHSERPVDVAYRSRICAYFLGDLAREKQIIAERFRATAERSGWKHDISTWEGDRLYGRAYAKFLSRTRCMLGTESGASVVDFTGDIQRSCDAYFADHPRATYEEVKRLFFADVDGRVVLRAISPRVFESAAWGNTLVLHEGEYSGLIRPGEHFIAVKKDYSNIDDVVAQINDRSLCERLAAATHRDLIQSDRYGYRSFVAQFDKILAGSVPSVGVAVAPSKAGFYAWNFVRHGQGVIPRGNGFVRVPNVDWVRMTIRAAISRVGLNVLRKVSPNPGVVSNLRTGLKYFLAHTWQKLPSGMRSVLGPALRPVSSWMNRTIFRPF